MTPLLPALAVLLQLGVAPLPPPPGPGVVGRPAAGSTIGATGRPAAGASSGHTSGTGPSIENPGHLARFFAALAARDAAPPHGRVRVTHLGDSHLAADMWSGRMRVLLQSRFGDAGRGFVLPGRPWKSAGQGHIRVEQDGDWRSDLVTLRNGALDDGLVGPASCAQGSTDPAAWIRLTTPGNASTSRSFSLLDVFYVRHAGGGCIAVEADGAPLGRINARGPWPAPAFTRFELSPGPHQIQISPAESGGQMETRLLGVSMENPEGLIWDAMGVNGAQARLLLRQAPIAMAQVLQRLDPTLLVVSYGTNELYDRHLGMETYAVQLDAVLGLLRRAAPGADCLVTGPFDLLKGRRAPAQTEALYEVARARAGAAGCAFWDARTAMGGPGSIRQWRRRALAQGDFVHLTRGGYELMGDLLAEALLRAYAESVTLGTPAPP